MKTTMFWLVAWLFFRMAGSSLALTHYVDQNCANPTPPYTDWATAATNIQDAVDAAAAWDEVLVTNGSYSTGGRALPGLTTTNRVAVDKPLTLQSINGPDVTTICGSQAAYAEVRCVYLIDGAVLSGFTLTNGGPASDVSTNGDDHVGGGVFCSATNALVTNCVLVANEADNYGGGAYGGTLNNCTLKDNAAFLGGGGAASCILNGCLLTNNSTFDDGGGVSAGTLTRCVLSGNTAGNGGGAVDSLLNNCVISENRAGYSDGGGAYNSTLNNCTLSQNYCIFEGGGASESTLNNCIIYSNLVDTFGDDPCTVNCAFCTLNYCCTTPIPGTCDVSGSGTGNITGSPLFVDLAGGNLRLQSNSPCINSGNNAYAPPGPDLDGNPRISAGTVDIGAYEFQIVTTHYVNLNSPNPTPPYTTWPTAATNIQDAVDAAVAGDEVIVTNGIYATGGRSMDGVGTNRVAVDKSLTVASVNGPEVTAILGYSGTGYRDSNVVSCVYLVGGSILSGFSLTGGVANPYVSPSVGGGVFCATTNAIVTNCILAGNQAPDYGGGAYGVILNNCTLSDNLAAVGGGTEACLLNGCLLSYNRADAAGGADDSTLSNCTLTGNSVSVVGYGGGGAAASCVLNDCLLLYNSVYGEYAYVFGGGAVGCVLNNCLLAGNSASESGDAVSGDGWAYGGGAFGSTLNNCTLVNNSARAFEEGGLTFGGSGGGLEDCVSSNCIVYSNGDNYDGCTLNFCCTIPMPTNGIGNITNAPLFINFTNGNFHLQSNSPCINSGNNAYAPPGPDLDGNPRIVGGTVDIGAYEFQNPASIISYAWLQQYGLPTDGSTDFTDPDGDGLNNWQEWRSGTNPTNALSVLRLLTPTVTETNVLLTWQSVIGINYFLERSTNLAQPMAFTALATNISGLSSATTYFDTNPVGLGPVFYRVGVH